MLLLFNTQQLWNLWAVILMSIFVLGHNHTMTSLTGN